jgi:hypothetical protein
MYLSTMLFSVGSPALTSHSSGRRAGAADFRVRRLYRDFRPPQFFLEANSVHIIFAVDYRYTRHLHVRITEFLDGLPPSHNFTGYFPVMLMSVNFDLNVHIVSLRKSVSTARRAEPAIEPGRSASAG